jgi:hypothetical protein
MSHRQRQHLGRARGQDRELPGRDVEGAVRVSAETRRQVKAARDVSRLIDENEGRDPQGGRPQRRGTQARTRGKRSGAATKGAEGGARRRR